MLYNDVNFWFPMRKDKTKLHIVETNVSKKDSCSYVVVSP